MHQRLLAAIVGAAATGLIAAPGSAAARTNCCFELAADVRQVDHLDYGTELPQPYHGVYSLLRSWSVRSIVGFHETVILHRPSFVAIDSQARLITHELSDLSDRHAKLENGVYSYPYEPIPCGSDSSRDFRVVIQGAGSRLKPVSGAVSLSKAHGYGLTFDVDSLFQSEPPRCGGGGDLALHPESDPPQLTVTPPERKFLREAANPAAHRAEEFEFPEISITHGGVAGTHTFSQERRVRLRISWFPKSQLGSEQNRLDGLECGRIYCHDDWGK